MSREEQIAQATAELRAILAAKEVTTEKRPVWSSSDAVYEYVRPAKQPQFVLDPPPEYFELLTQFRAWEGELLARNEDLRLELRLSHPAG
jgi:hypothetical protein